MFVACSSVSTSSAASSCVPTTCSVTPVLRCSSVSPTHTIGVRPNSSARQSLYGDEIGGFAMIRATLRMPDDGIGCTESAAISAATSPVYAPCVHADTSCTPQATTDPLNNACDCERYGDGHADRRRARPPAMSPAPGGHSPATRRRVQRRGARASSSYRLPAWLVVSTSSRRLISYWRRTWFALTARLSDSCGVRKTRRGDFTAWGRSG